MQSIVGGVWCFFFCGRGWYLKCVNLNVRHLPCPETLRDESTAYSLHEGRSRVLVFRFTPWKTNMDPDKHWLVEGKHPRVGLKFEKIHVSRVQAGHAHRFIRRTRRRLRANDFVC